MQCYSELLPPSGVTHSLRVAFTAPDITNLILAKTSLLQIFELKVSEELEQAKLDLIAEYSLQGTISALAKVTPIKSKSGGDALLIAFRDAKLSLIEWDTSQHSISTISIHYYENHDLLLSPWSPDLRDCITRLTVDPSSRCAAFNFNGNSLAIIPFHQAGDDLAMDDDSDSTDEKHGKDALEHTNGESQLGDKLYSPSFVLPMTALDPGLLHPVAMTFLHEYREPTVGVLFTTLAESMNMSPDRRDVLAYSVYTLDIDQKASTTLLSVTKLPNDLRQVIGVPAPIGGTLLIGGNELIHIDQGGRSNAVAINEFSKMFSSFAMTDQSGLQLRLEGCQVQHLETAANDVLLILNDGSFVVVSFRVDGRSVSGLTLQKIDSAWTAHLLQARCSTISNMGHGHLFLGSEEADSVLISTIKQAPQLKKSVSRLYPDDANGDIDVDEDEEDDDDDLYADSKTNGTVQQGTMDGSSISLKDTIGAIAPIQDIALGRPPKRKREDDEADPNLEMTRTDKLDLVVSCNKGARGSLAFLSRSLRPTVVNKHRQANISAVWSMSSELSELDLEARPFDDMLVVSQHSLSSTKKSSLLSLSTKIEEQIGNDFEKGDRTIATGRLITGSHVVVYSRDVRAYNKDFGLDQIFAIVDEDADAAAEVIAATVTDTHILIHKDDHTLSLLKVDKSGDLDEVDLPGIIPTKDIVSACIYDDQHDFFDTRRFIKTPTAKSLVLTVLTKAGGVSCHPISNLGIQVFSYAGLHFLPKYLSSDQPIPKHWRNQDALTDMKLCTLGSSICGKPYLVISNTSSDVTIYEPYALAGVRGSYSFIKVSCHNGDSRETDVETEHEAPSNGLRPMLLPLHDLDGKAVCFVLGQYPRLVSKSTAGMPRVHGLETGPMAHLSSFHDSSCNRGFVYVSIDKELTFCEIPSDLLLDNADWVIKKIDIGEEITALTYHPRTGSYVLATATPAPFHLPRDDEWRPEWSEKDERATSHFLPTTKACSLKLISSSTHSVISQYSFGRDELVLSIKCLNIEVSEQTHERRDLVVVGTGIARGENVVTRGYLYLFDVVDVVPQPDIPETDLKLKLITKEDVRGAVTAISSIGSQGFILAAQGQKCMVRGLREDNAILPVAFMDMRYYISVAKELPGTGLTILADAFSGLWLMGYSEEPYKMQLLGRDLENPSIVAAEFMPQDKQLYIFASDGNGELRVLQYDPWNPKTERGSILLHKSTFNTGYYPTSMTLLPRSPTPSEALLSSTAVGGDDDMQIDSSARTSHQILITTREGAIALVTPLSEMQYRRLNALQTTLTANLDQLCGLNPRAHRQIETDGVGGRALIDGQVVKRFLEQSSQHKHSLADRVGGTVWDVRADLEAIGGAGLGYL